MVVSFFTLSCVQLEESNQVLWQQQAWEHGQRQQEVQQLHGGGGFFHPLDAAGEPTLQIGYVPPTPSTF
jgi:deferrochelatase/peroxidase EfeB